jgi:hypothetical protein
LKKTGAVSWQRYNRPNSIKGGGGFIESGILFLGPGEYDVHENMSKKKWHENLGVLPEWEKTFAWSRHNFLHRVTPQVTAKLSFWQKKKPWRRHQGSIQWEQWFKRFSRLLTGRFRMTCYIIFFILKKAVDVLGFLMNFFI